MTHQSNESNYHHVPAEHHASGITWETEYRLEDSHYVYYRGYFVPEEHHACANTQETGYQPESSQHEFDRSGSDASHSPTCRIVERYSASLKADEKRKINASASTRFRQRRKENIQALGREIAEKNQIIEILGRRLREQDNEISELFKAYDQPLGLLQTSTR
ncbi:hypothetical protein ABW20_dc0103954 [Dactylellina cionopaga]|nr:hypothetical protein ABW20_dc0103954 [Dactylellina cionopaga]